MAYYIDIKKIKTEIARIRKWVDENEVSDDYKTGVSFGLIALEKFIDKQKQECVFIGVDFCAGDEQGVCLQKRNDHEVL